MAPTSGMIAGAYNIMIATRDSSGYPVGQNATPDTKVQNTVYSPYKAKYMVSFTPPEPTLAIATRRGGMAQRGKRYLGVEDFGEFEITMDGFDETFHALISDTTVDSTTLTGWSTTALNAGLARPPKLCLLMTAGYTDDTGDIYLNVFFNNVTIAPRPVGSSQEGGVNPNPLTYTVVPDTSSRRVDGRLYSALTNQPVRDNSDIGWHVKQTYEMAFSTFIGNAAATTFTLPYKPIYSDVTGALNNSITVNGTSTAVTTISTATGVVTFSAAPAANAVVVVTYPTAFA